KTNRSSFLALMLVDLMDRVRRVTSRYRLAASNRKMVVQHSSTCCSVGAKKPTSTPSKGGKSHNTYSKKYSNGPKSGGSASTSTVAHCTSGAAKTYPQTRQASPMRFIDAGQIFFKIDHVLVRVSDPTADPTHAARLRRVHNYNGPPGGEGDPVKGGKRLTPVLHSDTEAVRAIIAEHIATKIAIQIGKGNKATIKNVIGSFAFKSNSDIRQGPDGPTLRDLCKRALPERASEVAGIVTAPIMARLPASTKPEDLLREDADYIVTEPGVDVASGMYFAAIGKPVARPAEP